MKKIILSVAVLLACYSAKAQIVTDAGTFTKPVKGTTIFEVNATPDITGGSIFALPSVNSDLGTVGIKVRKFHSATKACRFGAHLSMNDPDIPGRDTDFAIGVSAGVEYHRAGAERLSTYWGYEGNVGYVTAFEQYQGQVKKWGVGANLFTGIDYYIIPKVYLGTEISWGAAIVNSKPEQGGDRTILSIAHGITPSFRLGWQF